MEMIKSYTDIEQSRKLAEILPLKSADYTRLGKNEDNVLTRPYLESCSSELKEWIGENNIFPCWSLAVLYDILPNNEKETTTLSRGGWKIEPIEYLDNWWCTYEDENHSKDFTVSADNPVDACVATIEKLHELNLL